jgi:diguanylate cyclase (GGDEF)-like protein
VIWVGQNVTLTFSGTGEPLGYQAIVRDVSEQRANEDALQQLSLSDALTGIGNRRCFDDFLDREWRRAARERTSLALVMCDVDFFKKYNDRYGHPAGDEVLKAVGQALGTTVKRPTDLATRYGGEEFALLLPDTTPEGALHLAEQARAAVAALGILHEESHHQHVSLSLGVAIIQPTPGSNAALLVQAADRALYQAKEAGRNQVVLAEEQPPALAHTA